MADRLNTAGERAYQDRVRRARVEQCRRNARAGGLARARAMTPAERRALSRLGSAARRRSPDA